MSSPVAAKLEGVVRRFDGRTVLDVDCIEFEAGAVRVLVGPNGAGKTTLLRLVAGLDSPDAGKVTVLGRDLGALGGAGLLALRRRTAFAAQKPYMFLTTVRRNAEYPLAARGVPAPERRGPAEAALSRLGVGHLADRRARTLSAGEAQRVALARAVVTKPELLLLDEPFANVDPEGAPVIERLVLDAASSGAAVVVATHVVEQAYRLSAGVVRLERGKPVPGAVENLFEGEVRPTDGGLSLVLECGLGIAVVTDRRGPARAAVDPADVVLSRHELDSSARNSLRGRVVELRHTGRRADGDGDVVMVKALVDVGGEGLEEREDCTLTASVTPESCRELGLTVGSEVVLTFKATAVKVF